MRCCARIERTWSMRPDQEDARHHHLRHHEAPCGDLDGAAARAAAALAQHRHHVRARGHPRGKEPRHEGGEDGGEHRDGEHRAVDGDHHPRRRTVLHVLDGRRRASPPTGTPGRRPAAPPGPRGSRSRSASGGSAGSPVAPSADRTASSRARSVARANCMFITFTHAMSRRPTQKASIVKSVPRRTGSVNASRSGSTLAVLNALFVSGYAAANRLANGGELGLGALQADAGLQQPDDARVVPLRDRSAASPGTRCRAGSTAPRAAGRRTPAA